MVFREERIVKPFVDFTALREDTLKKMLGPAKVGPEHLLLDHQRGGKNEEGRNI